MGMTDAQICDWRNAQREPDYEGNEYPDFECTECLEDFINDSELRENDNCPSCGSIASIVEKPL